MDIFCKMCGVKIPAEKCAFTYKRVINGREHIFCCPHCMEDYEHGQVRN